MFVAFALLAAASGWTYEKKVDQFTDAVTHGAWVDSTSGKMTIMFDCGVDKKPTYSFVTASRFGGEYVGGEGIKRIAFDLRPGDRPAVSMEVLGFNNVAPAYFEQGPNYGILDTEINSGQAKLIVRAQLLGGGLATESFDTSAAKEAIGKAKAACGIS